MLSFHVGSGYPNLDCQFSIFLHVKDLTTEAYTRLLKGYFSLIICLYKHTSIKLSLQDSLNLLNNNI